MSGDWAFIALIAGIVALVLVVALGLHTWLTWQRFSRTSDAAELIITTHAQSLEQRMNTVGTKTGHIADRSEELSDSVARLQHDLKNLTYLATRISHYRRQLTKTLLDALLPTNDDDEPGRDE